MPTIAQEIDKLRGNATPSKSIAAALGAPAGAGSIAAALSKYESMDLEPNPLDELAIDFDIDPDTDLLGKSVTDLQEDVAIKNGNVTGTSLYVTDYTGFSGLPEEQEGNYLAMHASVGDMIIGTDVTIKINGVTLDPDGLHILILKGGKKPVKVEAIKDGHKTVVKYISLAKLVREEKPED